MLPIFTPPALNTAKVTEADCVVDGLAYATPVAVCANVANFVVGAVSAFTLASPKAAPVPQLVWYKRYSKLACTGPVHVAIAQPCATGAPRSAVV